MTITKEQLLIGCSTVIKEVLYERTSFYVHAFLTHVEGLELEISVKLPEQSIGDDPQITYNRVFIKAYHPVTPGEFRKVECFCYALDTKVPAAKYFQALEDNGVLFVTNPGMQISLIKPDEPMVFDFKRSITDNTKVTFERLSRQINKTQSEFLGSLILQSMSLKYENLIGSIKLADTVPISAYKMLYQKKDSILYIKTPQDSTYFNNYLGLCKVIQDDKKEMFNVCEKLQLALSMVNSLV